MRENQKEMVTTKEAATILNVKPSTIHKYVREGKIKPVYEENWQIDATKLFYLEDVERLKNKNKKPGITTGEAAELLGLHITTISQYISKGILKAEKKLYKGRSIFFIEPAEIERFKSSHEINSRKEQKEFFDKETGYAWFQSFTDCNGNKNNRILLNEEGEPYLQTHDGRKVTLDKIDDEGFTPNHPISDIDYISKRGYVKFTFIESEKFYSIIELFYRYIGPKNMKLTITKNKSVNVEIKPVFIKEAISDELIYEMEKSLLEGNLIKRLDGLILNSDLEVLTVAVPSELKELIKDTAEKRNSTIEEVVLNILKEGFRYKEQ